MIVPKFINLGNLRSSFSPHNCWWIKMPSFCHSMDFVYLCMYFVVSLMYLVNNRFPQVFVIETYGKYGKEPWILNTKQVYILLNHKLNRRKFFSFHNMYHLGKLNLFICFKYDNVCVNLEKDCKDMLHTKCISFAYENNMISIWTANICIWKWTKTNPK